MATKAIRRLFADDKAARAYLEEARWPKGPVCPHCGGSRCYRLKPRKESKSPVRPGVYTCGACRKQFTVTVGTMLSGSHMSLSQWLYLIHLVAEAKKGMSAKEAARRLGINYRTAFRVMHQLRVAMMEMVLLRGDIEADETFVGRRRRGNSERNKPASRQSVVVTVYARGSKKVRSTVVDSLRGANLAEPIAEADNSGRLITDGRSSYQKIGKGFGGGHAVINKRSDLRPRNHTATTDSYHSLVKSALRHVYQGVSPEYLPIYMIERDWHFNHRDDDRFALLSLAVLGGAALPSEATAHEEERDGAEADHQRDEEGRQARVAASA